MLSHSSCDETSMQYTKQRDGTGFLYHLRKQQWYSSLHNTSPL